MGLTYMLKLQNEIMSSLKEPHPRSHNLKNVINVKFFAHIH